MTATAKAARPPATEPALAVAPSWAAVVEMLQTAVDDERQLTVDERATVTRAIGDAPEGGKRVILTLEEQLGRIAAAHRIQAAAGAADRARQGREAQAASRQPAFDALPQWLRWEWTKLDRAGGLSTTEGRQMARLLEGVEEDQELHVPSCYRPLAPEPGRY